MAHHHHQCRRVEHVAIEHLHKGLAFLRIAALHDLFVDCVTRLAPTNTRTGKAARFGDAECTIEGDPTHHARVGEVLRPAAHLPDSLVLGIPILGEPIQQLHENLPELIVNRGTRLVVQVDAVDQLAVDIEL